MDEADPQGDMQRSAPEDAEGIAEFDAEGTLAQPETAPTKKRRKHRLRTALIVVGVVVVVVVVAAFVTAHYTSRSSFCDTCHEMHPYYTSWQDSGHATAECRDCHIPPGIIPYIQTKLFSFREIWVHFTENPVAPLGVTREIPPASCERCHDDPADQTWANTSFSHAEHATENCIDCHVRVVHDTVNPPYFKDPAKMSSCLVCHDGQTAPKECSYCHTPGHEPKGDCSSCHNQQSWGFTDEAHPFPRTDAHSGLACTDCHVSASGVQNIPGTQLAEADPACVSCHKEKHGGLTDCASCHTTTKWTSVRFQHPFPREAAHADLACTDCHVSTAGGQVIPGTHFPAADPACASCHGDKHGGLTDCASCHKPTAWTDVSFKHPLALTGAHANLGCSACHGTTFTNVSASCVSCHGVQHGGLTRCASCHTTKAWKPSTFRHPRVGEHMPSGEHRLSCSSCHKSGFATASCTPCHTGTPNDD